MRKVGAGVAFVAEQAIAATGATSEQQAEMREVTAARLRSTGKKNARDAGAASVDQTKMHGVVFEALYNGLLRCAAVKRRELLVALSFSCSKQCFLLEVNLFFTALHLDFLLNVYRARQRHFDLCLTLKQVASVTSHKLYEPCVKWRRLYWRRLGDCFGQSYRHLR